VKSETRTFEITPSARFDWIDLTDELRSAVKDSGITDGMVVAFCRHTTCALIINEWEDGAMADFRERLEFLVPDHVYYAHDDMDRRTQNLQESHERKNGHAHVKQMLLGATSHSIPVVSGEPMLGRWQRLLLVELDDPHDREIVFHVFGE
jgi:secondary thiamine-phosphate synthase enzyme